MVDARRGSAARTRRRLVRRAGGLLLLALAASIVWARLFAFTPFVVRSASMKPGLKIGELVMENRLAYGLRLPWSTTLLFRWDTPSRGDVVVFRTPEVEERQVKRVIGLPGETVSIDGGVIRIEGVPVVATFLGRFENWRDAGVVLPLSKLRVDHYEERVDGRRWMIQRWDESSWGPEVVPVGHLLVLGDNRDESSDSRAWGMLPVDAVSGTVAFAR